MFNVYVFDDMVYKWNKCYKFDFGIMLRYLDFFLFNIKVIIIENFILIIYIWFKKKNILLNLLILIFFLLYIWDYLFY